MRIDELRKRAVVWVLGPGLLRLHAALFAVGAVVLVAVALYRRPDELPITMPLRLWTVILACHVAALVAGWSTWRAVRPHRLPPQRPVLPLGMAIPPRAAVATATWPANGSANGHHRLPNGLTAVPPQALNGQSAGGQPAVVPVPPRGRFNPPISRPVAVGHRPLPTPGVAGVTTKLRGALAATVASSRQGWQRVSRATARGATALAGSVRRPFRSSSPAGATPPPAPVHPGWPPPPAGVEPAASITPSPAMPAPPPGWENVVPPPPTDEQGAPSAETGAAQITEAAPPNVQPATEWTWMEAAAAAWLARRDGEVTPAETPVPAEIPASGAGQTTPAAEPPSDPSQQRQ